LYQQQNQNAKIILHQTQRLVTLADDIYKIKPRDSLRVLFLIICAEAVAKLYKNFTKEGDVYKHIELFFTELCNSNDQKILGAAFCIQAEEERNKRPLCLSQAIRYLYKVRCDVVHEGRYWEFSFNRLGLRERATINFKREELIYSKITYKALRNIVIKGAIRAIEIIVKR